MRNVELYNIKEIVENHKNIYELWFCLPYNFKIQIIYDYLDYNKVSFEFIEIKDSSLNYYNGGGKNNIDISKKECELLIEFLKEKYENYNNEFIRRVYGYNNQYVIYSEVETFKKSTFRNEI